MADKITTSQARETISQITKEVHSLEPSALCVLYEIDLSKIKRNLNLGTGDVAPDILRFHNMEAMADKKIAFRNEIYHALPIIMEGFEITSNASLPRPTMSFTSFRGILEEHEANEYYRSLKRGILELDNMIGATVTRIRTFSKFLDSTNTNINEAGDYTGSVNPEFPKEIYYVQRKVAEDKNGIQLELSSVLDLENFKLPGRVCVADRCPWVYRGEGCCFEFKASSSADLKKQKNIFGATDHVPDFAPPIADDENVPITGSIVDGNGDTLYIPSTLTTASSSFKGEYASDVSYSIADVVFVTAFDDIKYYYVCKKVAQNISPPHSDYWVADRCSKSLKGCKLRWGNAGAAENTSGSTRVKANKFLPFGGFPGTNTKVSIT